MLEVAGGIVIAVIVLVVLFFGFALWIDVLDDRRTRKLWRQVNEGNEMRKKLGYHV